MRKLGILTITLSLKRLSLRLSTNEIRVRRRLWRLVVRPVGVNKVHLRILEPRGLRPLSKSVIPALRVSQPLLCSLRNNLQQLSRNNRHLLL